MAGWATRAKNGAMPISTSSLAATSTGISTFTPSASSTSMLPARLEAARFPCLATGTPAPATTKAAAVEMLKVFAPSPPVPQVSTARGSGQGSWRARARAARAAATISETVSPLVRSATSRAAHRMSEPPPSMISPKAASSIGAGTSRPSLAVATAARRLMRPPLAHDRSRGNARAAACRRG